MAGFILFCLRPYVGLVCINILQRVYVCLLFPSPLFSTFHILYCLYNLKAINFLNNYFVLANLLLTILYILLCCFLNI